MRATLVVDASVVIKWLVSEQGSEQALRLRTPDAVFAAPNLLLSECANIAWKKCRRGQLTHAEADIVVGLLSILDISLHDLRSSLARLLAVAVALDHPVYDCEYLVLAEHLRVPFVTADAKLRAKVEASGLPLPTVMLLGDGAPASRGS